MRIPLQRDPAIVHSITSLRRLLIPCLACLGLIAVSSCSNNNDDPANIIFINLDDADVDLLDEWAINKFFPNIKKYIQDTNTCTILASKKMRLAGRFSMTMVTPTARWACGCERRATTRA